MSKLRKTLLKVGIVSTSVLMAIVLTGAEIAKYNSGAISEALKQPTFETIQKPGTEGEQADTEYFKSKYKSVKELSEAGRALVEKIEAEGAVLLKNENKALPLAKDAKVSLFGLHSILPSLGGRGSSASSNPQDPDDFYEGFANAGLQCNTAIKDVYEAKAIEKGFLDSNGNFSYPNLHEIGYKDVKDEIAAKLGDYDTAVYVISRTGTEAQDMNVEPNYGKFDRTDDKKDKKERRTLNLSTNEKNMLKGLAELKAAGKVKKIVVLLNSTNQIQEADFLKEYNIDASLWIGHLGTSGATAVGKLLNGTYNPSGSLPDTFYYKHSDNPVMMNYPVKELADTDKFPEFEKVLTGGQYNRYYAYQEGIYVGYRYAETRYTDVVEKRPGAGNWDYEKVIAAPFGYGLSYTTFEYSDFDVKKADDGYDVSVKVTNTGDVAGKNSVEIYLQKPFDQFDIDRNIEKASVELVGFEKTKELAAGESETVNVHVDGRSFATYDRVVDKTYIVTPGEYRLTAAHDAHDAANNFLASKGKTEAADKMTANGHANMVETFKLSYDKTTYNTSEATGKTITNLFDDADINLYDGKDNKLEFLSRTNWEKELTSDLKATRKLVDDLVRQLNSEFIEKGEGAYPTYGKNAGLQLAHLLKDDQGNPIEYDDPVWDTFLDQLTWEDTVELVRDGYRRTVALPSINKPGTLDHNGPTGLTQTFNRGNGLASKLDDPDKTKSPVEYPSIPVLAASFSQDLAAEFGNMLGEEALWAGYSGFYGVGLNTHHSPYAGRNFEYWSEDPLLAGKMAAAQVTKLQSHGCNAYVKHFALNDQELQRNNVQIWSNEQALREVSLRSFEIAIVDGGAMNAMISFTRIGATMCPGSSALIKGFLRNECGMMGVAVTDMYGIGYQEEMLASFFMAGINVPDSDKILAEYFDQYKTGYPALAREMRESAKRVLYHTVRSNAMNGIDTNTIIRQLTPAWQKALIGVEAVSITLFSAAIIWGVVELVLELLKKKKLAK